jgi:hypothetical protein
MEAPQRRGEELTGRAGRDGMILWIWRKVKVGCEKGARECNWNTAMTDSHTFLLATS